MTENPTLSDVLDRLVLIAQSAMDSGAPVAEDGDCYLCCVRVDDERRAEGHDPDCGWLIARTAIAVADLDAVRRLARAMRWTRRPK